MDMVQLKNQMLQDAVHKVESQLDPKNRDNYMKIVVAGMHVGLDKGPNGILASLAKSKDPISDAAKGAIGVVLGMKKEAKGVMPDQAMIPAAMTLMLKALDFVNNSGIMKITNVEIDRATKIFADTMMKVFKVSPGMVKHAAGQINQMTSNPEMLQKMKYAAGVEKRPNAATTIPVGKGMINGAA